jgi:hypothetical protein
MLLVEYLQLMGAVARDQNVFHPLPAPGSTLFSRVTIISYGSVSNTAKSDRVSEVRIGLLFPNKKIRPIRRIKDAVAASEKYFLFEPASVGYHKIIFAVKLGNLFPFPARAIAVSQGLHELESFFLILFVQLVE